MDAIVEAIGLWESEEEYLSAFHSGYERCDVDSNQNLQIAELSRIKSSHLGTSAIGQTSSREQTISTSIELAKLKSSSPLLFTCPKSMASRRLALNLNQTLRSRAALKSIQPTRGFATPIHQGGINTESTTLSNGLTV